LELKIYHHKTFTQFPAAIPPPVPQRTRYSYLDLQGLVELAPLGPHKYHLKTLCKKAGGVFTKVLEALCSYNAQVTSLSTITYYGYAESVFSIEVTCSQQSRMHFHFTTHSPALSLLPMVSKSVIENLLMVSFTFRMCV
jgi:hypothetical protein